MSSELYPLLLRPVYKDYIWGGRRIPEMYARGPNHGVCAESWEVADRPEGMSIIENGPLAGTPLHTLVESHPGALVGEDCNAAAFPLLIKIIDARERLSLQVHPNDLNAARTGGEPKTEMWYVVDAAAGAAVLAGLVPGTTAPDFRDALRNNAAESLLRKIPVRRGDVVFVPGGRVHAIDRGCLLLEIQQNSNTTYRVYDWGRVGTDGKPRSLHVKQALASIVWEENLPVKTQPRQLRISGENTWWNILDCEHFSVERIDLGHPETVRMDGRSFHALFTIKGPLGIRSAGTGFTLNAGMSCLVPACAGSYELLPGQAGVSVIVSRLP